MDNKELVPENIEDRWDCLVKPQDSLGDLENWVVKLGRITGEDPPRIHPARVLLFAGDHGVVEEGVSAYPSSVTAQMLEVFRKEGAAINSLTSAVDMQFEWYNVGVRSPLQRNGEKVGEVAGNIREGPALKPGEVENALEVGRSAVGSAIEDGMEMIGLGDIGIGNTTPATAITAYLTGTEPEQIVGPGSGLDADGLEIKQTVLEDILERSSASKENVREVLGDIGGYEIASLTGAILEAHDRNLPILLDGLITTAPALTAQIRQPDVDESMLASHRSREPAHGVALQHLGLEPMVDFNLALGEGSGATLVYPLLRAAVSTYESMMTFEEAGISGSN